MSLPLDRILQSYGLPKPRLEYRFSSERKFRWDAAWPTETGGVALEVDGGLFVGGSDKGKGFGFGGHSRGKGYLSDREKDLEGQMRGWIVIHTTPRDVTSAKTIQQIRGALQAKGVL